MLALTGLLAILAAPTQELSHDHWLGQSHGDCPACQVKSNPGGLVENVTTTVLLLSYHLEPTRPPRSFLLDADPLGVAPKTSPPRPLS